MREGTAAYRASMATLERLDAWCRCKHPSPATSRPCGPSHPSYVNYCQSCQGLIKPDADDAAGERGATDGR